MSGFWAAAGVLTAIPILVSEVFRGACHFDGRSPGSVPVCSGMSDRFSWACINGVAQSVCANRGSSICSWKVRKLNLPMKCEGAQTVCEKGERKERRKERSYCYVGSLRYSPPAVHEFNLPFISSINLSAWIFLVILDVYRIRNRPKANLIPETSAIMRQGLFVCLPFNKNQRQCTKS